MSFYREVRVRPVVRYIVTLFERIEDGISPDGRQHSQALGEFDNVNSANNVAAALFRDFNAHETPDDPERITVYEPARKLHIDWSRGPGEPQEAIRWVLSEPDAEPTA